jgi:hypothetical protein
MCKSLGTSVLRSTDTVSCVHGKCPGIIKALNKCDMTGGMCFCVIPCQVEKNN